MKTVVLMCMQYEHLEISPARLQLLEELSCRGYETCVVLNGRLKQKHKFPYVNRVINAKKMKCRDIRKRIMGIKPAAVIATTVHDAGAIYLLPWIMKGVKFYYYNLEIYTSFVPEDLKKGNAGRYLRQRLEYPVNKAKEIIYTKRVKALTIQDGLRKRLLSKYHIRHENTMLIPNSYVFDEAAIASVRGNGVIYTGSISQWCMAEWLAGLRKVANIPITFSGWMDNSLEIEKLGRANPNITFAIQQLHDDEYTEYLKQFAVGLVIYNSTRAGRDENVHCIGLSSGKMFKYLSLGLPVIATKSRGIAGEVRKHKLGIVIDDMSELENAYLKIMENYQYYQENVIRTYKKIYDFRKAAKPFLDCMESEQMA